MFKIRPHHLICMQAYIGKGYSDEFVENMDFIVDSLRKNSSQTIQIIDFNDDICSKCPNNIDGYKCSSNDKVLSIDKKVIKFLELETKEYSYNLLLEKLKTKFNEKEFKKICSCCEWYKNGICEAIFRGKGCI